MKLLPFLILFSIILLVDIYVYYNLKNNIFYDSLNKRKIILIYIAFSSLTYISLAIMLIVGYKNWVGWSKNILLGTAQAFFIAKLFMLPFFLLSDITQIFAWIINKNESKAIVQNHGMSRLSFLYKSALIVGTSFFGGFMYGIIRGAYNIKTNYIKIKIKNLPSVFKSIKIVQISDLHVGSYPSAKHLQNMVEKINRENADFLFFTGDLVNFRAVEAKPYLDVLSTIKVKKGIYSILGNHDYGHYYDWKSQQEEMENINLLIQYQKKLGWKLLLDEHEIIPFENHNLAIIGIQYWGHSMRFGKIGNLKKAYQNAENADLQLLLSHDPSHWDHEVNTNQAYKKIDVTFSGHTHGFQFGVEIPKLKFQWSPSQYVYPHWAGLYSNQNQYLYVNRGMGYIAYPGRLGVPPEISVFTFES
jgi:predicted MPP superfamily phosphohydrolase